VLLGGVVVNGFLVNKDYGSAVFGSAVIVGFVGALIGICWKSARALRRRHALRRRYR